MMTRKADIFFVTLGIFTFIALSRHRPFCKKKRERQMFFVSSKVIKTLVAKMRIYGRAKGKVNMMEKY